MSTTDKTVDAKTLAAAKAASDAAALAGLVGALAPTGKQTEAAEAAAGAEAGAALGDAVLSYAEQAENTAFAALVEQAGTVGEALGGALAASKGRVWLKDLAAQCAQQCQILLGVIKADASGEQVAAAELERLCGLYDLARRSARSRVERFASCPALCMKKGDIVKSQMRSIRQVFDRVLGGLGVKLDPETLNFEPVDIKADKSTEDKVAAAVVKAAGQSMAGLIAGLKELGPLAIGRICAELARSELARRYKVAEQQAEAFAEILADLDRKANAGDTVAMGACIGATRQLHDAVEHVVAIRELVRKAA
jgi:hypothetical protein